MKTILFMERNELPRETFSLGNAEIKCLILLYGEGDRFGLGKKRGGRKGEGFYSLKYI